MNVKYSELSKELQKEAKSILNGNGLKVSDAQFFKDGENVVMYVKKTDTHIPLSI